MAELRESNIYLEMDRPDRNLNIQRALTQLQAGESKVFTRAEFRNACDEQDRIIYMSFARVIADRFGCELQVLEDDLKFTKIA